MKDLVINGNKPEVVTLLNLLVLTTVSERDFQEIYHK